MYEKEADQIASKIETLKSQGADEYVLRKQVQKLNISGADIGVYTLLTDPFCSFVCRSQSFCLSYCLSFS